MAERFSCEICSFAVQGDDQEEVIETAQRHAQEKHGKDLSEREVKESMEAEGTAAP